VYPTAAYHTCTATPAIPQTLTIQLPSTPSSSSSSSASTPSTAPKQVYFPYYTSGNIPIEKISPEVPIVVVLHGATRIAAQYLCAVEGAAAISGLNTSNVQIIAPHFLASTDPDLVDAQGRPLLYWNGSDPNGPWRAGYTDMNKTISSYAVMDALFAALPCPRDASKRTVTFAGHSSGGQFVQRYTLLGSHRANLACGGKGSVELPMKNVVANPSSYAYFDGQRAVASTGGTPGVPPQWYHPNPATCPGYTGWEWGLDGGLPDYRVCSLEGGPSTANLTACVERYGRRPIVYMVGANDTCTKANAASGPNNGKCPDHGLETTCMDELEGLSRHARSVNFFAYQGEYLQNTTGAAPRAEWLEVPWSGHDHIQMFQSPAGRAVLFGQ
jgi:hypothetical protein